MTLLVNTRCSANGLLAAPRALSSPGGGRAQRLACSSLPANQEEDRPSWGLEGTHHWSSLAGSSRGLLLAACAHGPGAVRSAETGGRWRGSSRRARGEEGRRGRVQGQGRGRGDETLPVQVPESLGEESRSWHAQDEEPRPVLSGRFLSGCSLGTSRPTLAESRVGGSVFCPLVGAWRCAAVSRSGLTPLPLFPQGCSSHLQHLEAVSLSSQWANPPKARRQCPLAQPRSARLPPRALGLPEGSSGLGVAVEGGLLCRIGSRGGCMGKDPMARNTPPCPAGPRGPEPRPSLLGRERPCWGGADQRPERGGCSGVTLPQGERALGSRSCGPESPSQQRPGAVGLGGGEEPAKGRPAWGGHQHVSRRKGGDGAGCMARALLWPSRAEHGRRGGGASKPGTPSPGSPSRRRREGWVTDADHGSWGLSLPTWACPGKPG